MRYIDKDVLGEMGGGESLEHMHINDDKQLCLA